MFRIHKEQLSDSDSDEPNVDKKKKILCSIFESLRSRSRNKDKEVLYICVICV